MSIVLSRLKDVQPARLCEVLNDPEVRHHMPLASALMDEASCAEWIASKEQIWEEHGYGP